jgi:molybdopterin-guanine dinucleotide biosynthesis protein
MRLAIEHQTTRVGDNSHYIFGRKEFADNLKNIFNNTESGFVLAIDATWGAGKTSFIHQLIHELKTSEDLIPIYYDAFANDFSSDTFLSIGATIFSEVQNHFQATENASKAKKQIEHLKKVTKNTAIELVKLGTNLAVKSITAGIVNNSDIEKLATKAFSSATFGTLELDLTQKFKAYENAKNNIQSYVSALESISVNNEKVVFFIDELDRCRPDFAVEVLEKVKHLFSAKNVIFVISYNKAQLSKIISNVYGVDELDSLKYLEKFIHIEANLPLADHDDQQSSYEHLFDSFIREFNIQLPNHDEKLDNLKEMFVSLCLDKHLNMNSREIERAFSYVSFCFAALPKNKGEELFEFFLPAAMIKVKSNKLFKEISNGKFYEPLGNNVEHTWPYKFFKNFYSESLKQEAFNVFYVSAIKEACGIVSIFKLPADEIVESKI